MSAVILIISVFNVEFYAGGLHAELAVVPVINQMGV